MPRPLAPPARAAPGAPPRKSPAPPPSTKAATPRSARSRARRRATAEPGGSYTDSSKHAQAFVVSETAGSWSTAQEVPGTAALNKGGNAAVGSVSCASAGNCGAGGSYTDSSKHAQAFVVSETAGSWSTAQEVPGTAALNKGGNAAVTSVSCRAVGDCAAVGDYTDSAGSLQVFVVSEIEGGWGTAQEIPGTAALNKGGQAEANSVSCAAAGDCGAGGYYADSAGNLQAFTVSETSGTWHTAAEIPGTAALNKGGDAQLLSLSCPTAGDCGGGGLYYNGNGVGEAFVASQKNGTWSAAAVSGVAVVGADQFARVTAVSCASAGDCSAGGFYTVPQMFNDVEEAFDVTETGSTWGTSKDLPGADALALGAGFNTVTSVSCGSAGDCAAVGDYQVGFHSSAQQAFVDDQASGTWGTAEEIPGTQALNAGKAGGVNSVSCASPGDCGAGGFYTDSSGHSQAFVVSETPG